MAYATSIDINGVARKLLRILSSRKQGKCMQEADINVLQHLFENIIPLYSVPGGYVYYPPLPQPAQVSHSWREIFSKTILNESYGGKINVDVDPIIGEAIWSRLSAHARDPHPFEYQVKAIVSALNALDPIRAALRTGRISLIREFDPKPSVIAVSAPTGGGKTEVFEAIILQLVLDAYVKSESKRNELTNFTKAIVVYPMKAFMIEHFRRFVRDAAYINSKLGTSISIGILDGDTPNQLETHEKVRHRLEYLLGSFNCPLCNSELKVKGEAPYYNIECSRSDQRHKLHVRIARDMIFKHPPDILLTTVDSFNYILLEQRRHTVLGKPSKYVDVGLPPVILAIDEPHVYTGVFGSNVSILLRIFDYIVRKYAAIRNRNIQRFKPLKLVTSATIPSAQEFLARLLVEDPKKIEVITSETRQQLQSQQKTTKGFLMFLPSPWFRFDNAIVEIVPLLAAILPKRFRKILVFVDSIELAEKFKGYMEDYIQRGMPDYKECRDLFEPDVYNPYSGFDPNSIKIAVHTSSTPRDRRERIEEGLRKSPPEYNIVIATPTLELGIDIGDITVVVMAGLPPTPEKFAQRAGRAGRRGPGLIIVVGNEQSAVDRYYLIDYNRAINYLQSSLGSALVQKYMLPLNPVNLESIRRFLGNFIAVYANITNRSKIQNLSGHNNDILRDYLSISLDQVHSTLSNTNLPMLQDIGSFASRISENIKMNLMEVFQSIIKEFKDAEIKHFVAPGIAMQKYFEGKIKYIPLVDNIRSINRLIRIRYQAGVNPSPEGGDAREPEEIDAKVALARYGLRYIEETQEPFAISMLKLERTNNIYPLRGTLHSRSLSHDERTRLFEVAGLFYSQLEAFNKYSSIRRSLEDFKKNLEIMRDKSMKLDRLLRSVKRTDYRVFSKLIETLDKYLKGSSQQYPSIVEPRVVYLVNPGVLGVDKDNMVYNVMKMKTRKLNLVPLGYFEIIPRQTEKYTYWDFSKISTVKCPYCNSQNLKLIEFNRESLTLRFECQQCRRRFDYKGEVPGGFIDHVRTKPVAFSVIVKEDSINPITRELPDSPFKLSFYREVNAFVGNIGFIALSSNKKAEAHRFMRTMSRGSNRQYILGFTFKTQALELQIKWDMLANLLKSITNDMVKRYSFPSNSILNTIDIVNDFKIRVTHTLSHLIINFAPIYTGGHTWDVSEYISFERDSQNNIISSSIIIFDNDEGGNGVSELIGYFIGDILGTAVSEAARYYMKQKNEHEKFRGEPGVTLFNVWPICPYKNAALSRSLTLLFVGRLLGLTDSELAQLPPDQISQRLSRLIPQPTGETYRVSRAHKTYP